VIIGEKAVSLPMDRYDAEQLLYEQELDAPGAQYEMELVDSDFLLALDSDFRELNRLAHRIDRMDDYNRAAFTAWCETQEPCTVDDALRASYHLDMIEFHPGFDCDELLGDFALDSELFEEYNGLPDEVYNMLDKAKAGARMREMQGGVFAEGGYLVAEPMDGLDYPQEEPLPPFEIESFEESGMVFFRTSWPQLAGHTVTTRPEEVQELYALNSTLTGLDGEQALKCKALFEVMLPGSICEARALAENLDGYAIEYGDPAAYAMDFLEQQYGISQDDPVLRYIDLTALGRHELRAAGYEQTRYGMVYVGDMEQVQEPVDDQAMGGMGGMTG